MRILLLLPLFVTAALLPGQHTDSLLRAAHWQRADSAERLLFTPDGTFQWDYGAAAGDGRYLMGRYETDPDNQEVTLSVDYFLGRRRIAGRYRRGQDFHLTYAIETVDAGRLLLRDVLTDERLEFAAAALDAEDDPARRRIRRDPPVKLKLPPGWGG